jgi:hypothetical protein
MNRARALADAAVLAVLILAAACSSGPATPTQTAASVLAASGATAQGPAYMVTVATQGTGPVCDAGSAEADGTFPGGGSVAVCVFPSQAQLDHDAATSVEAGAAGGATVRVGTLTLVYLSGRTPSAVQVASLTGGTVVVP